MDLINVEITLDHFASPNQRKRFVIRFANGKGYIAPNIDRDRAIVKFLFGIELEEGLSALIPSRNFRAFDKIACLRSEEFENELYTKIKAGLTHEAFFKEFELWEIAQELAANGE